MYISEYNYIKKLQAAEGFLNEVTRFLKRTKKDITPQVMTMQRDLRNLITKELKDQRQAKQQAIIDKSKKKND